MFRKYFGNTVLYYGCTIEIAFPEKKNTFKEILRKLGVDFIEISEFICCGYPLTNYGLQEKIEEHKKRWKDIIEKYYIKTMICPCPSCASFLSDLLKDFNVRVEYFYSVVNSKINEKFRDGRKVVLHEPCHVIRNKKWLNDVYSLLNKLGFEVVKIPFSGEYQICCGGGGGMYANRKEVSTSVAKMRYKMLKESKADIIATCCPMCLKVLSDVGPIVDVADLIAEKIL